MEPRSGYTNRLLLTDRKHLVVDGVEHVGKFNDREISLDTNMGLLTLRGEGLHITRLNLEEGNLVVEGRVDHMDFSTGKTTGSAKSRGMLERIFK